VLDRIDDRRKNFVIDFSAVPFLDSTAANVIEGAARKAQKAGVRVYVTGTSRQVRRTLLGHGVRRPLVRYAPTVADAVQRLGNAEGEGAP
jgi:SulP family sulfate permease